MRSHRSLQASLLVAAAAAAAVVLEPREALAEWDPVVHRSDVGVDMYLWSARVVGTTLPIIPFVQFEPTHNLFINLRFPVGTTYDGDTLRGGLGNPTFTLYYSDISGKLTWYAGGRVGAPLGLIDDRSYQYSILAAATTMAFYDAYLWAPNTIPFGGLGGIEYRFADIFVLRAGGDLILYPPLRRRGNTAFRSRDFDVDLQTKVEGEFQSSSGAGGGLAILAVWLPTVPGDNAQVSALPYFVYDSQDTFFMRLGALIALDPPLGFGLDRRRVATLYLQLGGHID